MEPTHTGYLHLDTADLGPENGGRYPESLAIDHAWWGSPPPPNSTESVVVLLHEGLGSVAQWREIPGEVHRQAGLPVFAFNRFGYGRSTPAPDGFDVRFMHTEGLQVLPRVLDGAGIGSPILVGHSDGGSISLIAAGSGSVSPEGVAVIAPHIYVEPECAAGIQSIEKQRHRIVAGLARHHLDPHSTFAAWNDVWLHRDFQSWDIRQYLPTIDCPVLAIQGDTDDYGTEAMITGIDEAVAQSRGAVLVPHCGHIAHRDQPEAIVTLIVDFIRSLRAR